MSGLMGGPGSVALWRQGEASLTGGNPDAARAAYEALLRLEPGHALARLRLSMLATRQGRYRESVAHLLAISATQPSDPFLLAMIAGMLHRLGESRAALQCVRHPGMATAADKALLEDMANLASQLGDMPQALRLLDLADADGRASANSLYLRGTVQLFEGRLADAEATLEASLDRAPANGQAHWALSRLRRQTPQHNHVDRLQAKLAARPDDGQRASLSFALFKELDDLDRPDDAWRALADGCASKRRQLNYRGSDEDAAFAALLDFDPAAPPSAAAPAPGPQPIFIVGLPRTGTTLLERILGRHPDVENAGELDDLPLQLRWCTNRFSKSFVDAAVFRAAAGIDFAELGQRYLEHAQWRANGKPRFTDKMPLNFLHVGYIARALPQARILHMVRDPMDSCLSNLKELFAEAYPYSYDLDELGAHYGRYRRLMAHWQARLPGRILDVSYEALVTDPEATARGVLAFCGLDWHPECIDIESNTTPVSTASSAQVRQPIHRRAIDSWRRYAAPLEPLRRRLATDGWIPA